METEPIMVCVQMCVYNHGRYLKKAIEGVLMQETNFRYELLISEDCSTDNSREIVVEYQRRYPHVIRALLNPTNLGAEENGRQIYETTKGKYMAVCEGDDYWTDPHKLQKQVDFLEANPDYSACYHTVQVVDEMDRKIHINRPEYEDEDEYDYDVDAWKNRFCIPGQSASMVAHNYFTDTSNKMIRDFYECKDNGDGKLAVLFLIHGKIRRMKEKMACYRRTYTGSSYNARTKGRDMRLFDYTRSLEREKFAERYMEVGFLPHSIPISILGNVIEERIKTGKGHLLEYMTTYDVGIFVSLLVANDFTRIENGQAPCLDTKGVCDFFNNENLSIVIMGAGKIGNDCYYSLVRQGLEDRLLGFWDNSPSKNGSFFHGKPITVPHTAFVRQSVCVVIASKDYTTEMRQQIESLGYVYTRQAFTFGDSWGKFLCNKYWESLRHTYPILMKNIGKGPGKVGVQDGR